MRRILLPLILAGIIFALPALASEYYIDADSGNDANSGAESTPWASLSMISSANIASGDTVYLKGTFEGAQQILLDSTIQGANADHPTIISNWPENSAIIKLSASHIIDITGDYFTISGIEFNNGDENLIDSYAIYLNDGYSGLEVEDCVINDADHAIKLYNANSDVAVNRNEFSNNLYTVNIGSNTENLTFTNNIFSNNIEYGIAGNTSTNINIYNNVFYKAHAGIYIAESTIDLQNNIFSDIDTEAIGFIIGETLSSDYNIFNNNTVVGRILTDDYYDYITLTDWQALGYDTNSVEADPLFASVTAGSEDFHLQATSPAIDAGTEVDNGTDIDTEARPYTAYDIGADERPVPSAPTDYGATVLSDTAVEVYWTAPSTAITSYILYLGQAADLSDAVEFSDIMYTAYDMGELTAGATYYVRLQSKYATDYQEYLSDYTSIFSFTTDNSEEEIVMPGKVQNVKVPKKYRKAHQIRVKWDSAGENLTYQIKLMNKNGKKIKTYATTNLNKTIKKLTGDKTYKVRVRAKYNDDHIGEWSKIITFKTINN